LTVAQRREIPEQKVFEEMVARAAALTATPRVNKVVLSNAGCTLIGPFADQRAQSCGAHRQPRLILL
jgi:isochorismate synthase